MTRFLPLTLRDGTPVYVNPKKIALFAMNDQGGTSLNIGGPILVHVKESPAVVLGAITAYEEASK